MVTDTLLLCRATGAGCCASVHDIRSILDLGMGTGETTVRLLRSAPRRHGGWRGREPHDAAAAAERLGSRLEESHVALLQERCPREFDLVVARWQSITSTALRRPTCSARTRSAETGRTVCARGSVVPERSDDAVSSRPGLRQAEHRWLSRCPGLRRRDSAPVSVTMEREWTSRVDPRRPRLSRQGSLVRCETRMTQLPSDYFNLPVADVDPEIAEILRAGS